MTSVPSHRLIDTNVPRYTSYPTAPHFHDGVTPETVSGWIDAIQPGEAISLYLHIPYCDRLCWFCACHTKQTFRYAPVADYLAMLYREIAMVGRPFGGAGASCARSISAAVLRPCSGRGHEKPVRTAARELHDCRRREREHRKSTPMTWTTRGWMLWPKSEPRAASLGIQDFDQRVQKAINREQSFETTRGIIEGFERGASAPSTWTFCMAAFQRSQTLGRTIELPRCPAAGPVAIFGYAHVPWFKKHQTMIDEATLPGPDARLAQAQAAATLICEADICRSASADSLAAAAREGRLTRNFQGYTDDRCETLIGLGPSSISRFRQGHAQNTPSTGAYGRMIEAGSLAVVRGLSLSDEDRMRGWVIEHLMCDFGFSVTALRSSFGAEAEVILREAALLAQTSPHFIADGDRFAIGIDSRLFARSIAAHFDSYLSSRKARHSAAI